MSNSRWSRRASRCTAFDAYKQGYICGCGCWSWERCRYCNKQIRIDVLRPKKIVNKKGEEYDTECKWWEWCRSGDESVVHRYIANCG